MTTEGQLRRRLNFEVFLDALVVPVWVSAGVFAASRLVLPMGAVAVLALGLVASMVRAGTVVRRRGWTDEQAAVVLDRLAGSGGLLLTLREKPGRAWESRLDEHLRTVKPPALQVRRPLGALVGAVAFAAASLLVPVPERAEATPNTAAVTQLEKLELDQQTLAEEEALPEGIDEAIAKLREELEAGRFDATDWEASDTARETLQEAGQRRAGSLAEAEEAARRLSEALAKNAKEEAIAREREGLEKALAGVEREGAEGKAGKPGTASQKELQELREALNRRRGSLEKQFGKGRPAKAGSGRAGKKQRSGKGGPAHGAAEDTPLRFGDELPVQTERLGFEALEKSRPGEEPGALWGLSSGVPETRDDVPLASPTGQARGHDDTPGVRDTTVPPRHRDTVRRYFDSKPAGR